MAFKITFSNHHDSREAVPLLKTLKGLAFGDKGYPGTRVFGVALFHYQEEFDNPCTASLNELTCDCVALSDGLNKDTACDF